MSAEAFWLFAPEEVAHGGAAACTYVSYDAFSQYVRDHVYGCPGAAVDVAGPQDLIVREIVTRERMLEHFLPALPSGEAPRFVGARMSVGTHVPFDRDLTMLDASAPRRARVLFCIGPARLLAIQSMQHSPADPSWQVLMRQRHGDALVLSVELMQRTMYGALNGGVMVAEIELNYELPAAQQ